MQERKYKNYMHNRFILAPALFLSLCLFSFLGASGVEAKSMAIDVHYAPDLYYGVTTDFWAWEGLYYLGLSGPTNISTAYHGVVYNNDTGVVIADGANVPVGTTLRFEQSLGTIAYTTTGTTSDTPFGDWVPGAVFPDGPVGMISMFRQGQCSSRYYVNNGTGYGYDMTRIYLPLSVNPPAQGISRDAVSQAKLSCAGNICTVVSPGLISTNFNFSDTYGKFYYEYDDVVYFPGMCNTSWDFSEGMRKDVINYRSGTEAVIPFPAQTITFNLTAVGGNAAPAAPVITPQPFTGPTSTAHTFSAQASDPEGDQIRYAFDWDNSSSVDAYIPPIGYVASNTLQSTQNPVFGQWTLPGTASFRVRTEDNQGGISPWTGAVATLTSVVNGLCGPASGVITSTPPAIGLCASGTPTPVTGTGPYAWTCLGSGGGTNDLTCTAPYIAPPTLKICENSCDSALDRTGQTFTMNQNATKSLKACYNNAVSCSSYTGDVTNLASWIDTDIPRNIISFQSQGQLQAGIPVGTMNENFNVSYLSETKSATAQVTCIPLTCLAAASVTDTYCPDETRDTGVSNSCGGALNCPGTRFCDTNYREVRP